MMRWNSTRTYTEEDILRMQQEAVSRVREFQSRAVPMTVYDVPEENLRPVETREVPPLSIAPATVHAETPLSEEPERPDAPKASQPSQTFAGSPAPNPDQPPQNPIFPFLEHLHSDNETLLILALMFLLYNEHADNTLLLALGYLLL